MRSVARTLGRAPSAIRRELKKNCPDGQSYKAAGARGGRPIDPGTLEGRPDQGCLQPFGSGNLGRENKPTGDVGADGKCFGGAAALEGFSRVGVPEPMHKQLSERTEAAVFFADSHSPWQRASNEHTNGLLCQ